MKTFLASPRVRRAAIIVAVLVVLYTVTGFFIAPPIVKKQLEQRVTAELGRPTTVGRVRLNPYALSVTLEDLAIRERDAPENFVGWRRLYANADLLASLGGQWVVHAVELDGLRARVSVDREGRANFADLLAKLTAPPTVRRTEPPEPPRPVRVERLQVTDARVDFTDRSRARPFETTVGPLTFSLTEFRTVGARGAPARFEAVTEAGEKLAWSGTVAADPVHAEGEITVQDVVLPKYAPYLDGLARAAVSRGKLSVSGRYEVHLAGKDRRLWFRHGEVRLRELQITEAAGGPVALDLPAVTVSGIEADAIAMKAAVGRVLVNGGNVAARRAADGSINLLAMLQPPAGATPPPVASPPKPLATNPPPPLQLSVGDVRVEGFGVGVTDESAPAPVRLALSDFQLALRGFSLTEGARMPFELSFASALRGTVRVNGSLALKPTLLAEVQSEVMGLELLPFSPYLEQFAAARLTQGAVSTTHRLKLALHDRSPEATFEGSVHLDKFGLVDARHNEELAGFGGLTLTGLAIATKPELSVRLQEVLLTAPYARASLDREGVLNLAQVARAGAVPNATAAPAVAQPAEAPAAAPAADAAMAASASAPLPRIEVGRVVIANGELSFVDRSIEPHVRVAVNPFGGTIAGLASGNPARADVDLKAVVDGVGRVALAGKIDPLAAKPFLDLKLDVNGVDLTALSPYSARFAGYQLARGKLVVDTKLALDGAAINAANVVSLDQFTFGQAVDSPVATKLPVRLGVALLKDTQGRIVIDLPVEGNLDDPEFRVGRVVLRVITNLLTKAAVSPFSLLGSMFGGGGDELAFQVFAPGAATLAEGESRKLETLTRALNHRPALALNIEGSFEAAADGPALRLAKFDQLVRRAAWESRRAADPAVAPPEKFEPTPEERHAAIRRWFNETFPPGSELGAPLPPPPPAAAEPPPPRGLLRRIVRAVTFQGAADERAARQREEQRLAEQKAAAEAAARVAELPLDVMTARLLDTIAVDDNDLRALASRRAQVVRDYFLNEGRIAADRIFLADTATAAGAQGKGAKVFLELR